MAVHAASNGDVRLPEQPIPLRNLAMAGLARRARAKVVLVAEQDVTRNLVYTHPRDRLFPLGERGQLLNWRAVLLHRLVAGHALGRRRNAHHFAGVRHPVAIGALQAQSDVLFVAIGNRLRRRLGRPDGNRNCQADDTAQMFFFRISSAITRRTAC